jgi:plasmid stabilization system protein ParE
MTVQRSERFDADLERQFRWYLLETDLDPVDALELATRFAEAVDAALESLRRSPEMGRRRFATYPDLAGTRSWPVRKQPLIALPGSQWGSGWLGGFAACLPNMAGLCWRHEQRRRN